MILNQQFVMRFFLASLFLPQFAMGMERIVQESTSTSLSDPGIVQASSTTVDAAHPPHLALSMTLPELRKDRAGTAEAAPHEKRPLISEFDDHVVPKRIRSPSSGANSKPTVIPTTEPNSDSLEVDQETRQKEDDGVASEADMLVDLTTHTDERVTGKGAASRTSHHLPPRPRSDTYRAFWDRYLPPSPDVPGLPRVPLFLGDDFHEYLQTVRKLIQGTFRANTIFQPHTLESLIVPIERITWVCRIASVSSEFLFRAESFLIETGVSLEMRKEALSEAFVWLKSIISHMISPLQSPPPLEPLVNPQFAESFRKLMTHPLQGLDSINAANSLLRVWFFQRSESLPDQVKISWNAMINKLGAVVQKPYPTEEILPVFFERVFQSENPGLATAIVSAASKYDLGHGSDREVDEESAIWNVQGATRELFQHFLKRITSMSMIAWQGGSEVLKSQLSAYDWLRKRLMSLTALDDIRANPYDPSRIQILTSLTSTRNSARRSRGTWEQLVRPLLMQWLNSQPGSNIGHADLFDSQDLLRLPYNRPYMNLPDSVQLESEADRAHPSQTVNKEAVEEFEGMQRDDGTQNLEDSRANQKSAIRYESSLMKVISPSGSRIYHMTTSALDRIKDDLRKLQPIEVHARIVLQRLTDEPEGYHDMIYRMRRLMMNFVYRFEQRDRELAPEYEMLATPIIDRSYARLSWLTDTLSSKVLYLIPEHIGDSSVAFDYMPMRIWVLKLTNRKSDEELEEAVKTAVRWCVRDSSRTRTPFNAAMRSVLNSYKGKKKITPSAKNY